MSKKSDSTLLKNVLAIAAVLIVFVVVLRTVMAPLYQEMDDMERTQQLELAQSRGGGSSNGGGGYANDSGSATPSENVNINVGNTGWFNWALGWIWGGPGWYSGPDYGWWGANVWNGWRNWWGGNNWNDQRRVWNGNFNDSINRNRSTEIDSDRDWNSHGARNDDAERFHNRTTETDRKDSFRESRDDSHSNADHVHTGGGGDSHGGRK